MKTRLRNYRDLQKLTTFNDRYNYLRCGGTVGGETFGHDRWVNQNFYRSKEWHDIRNHVIVRDNGCDLGLPGYEIYDRIYIHHMNPITVEDVIQHNDDILNPDYLICVSFNTHQAIHYGDESLLPQPLIERLPGDTTLW